METFDAIKEAGHLADLSNTKQSTDVSDYYLSSVQKQAAAIARHVRNCVRKRASRTAVSRQIQTKQI